MTDKVYAQAMLMVGAADFQQLEMLKLFCQAAVKTLTARLREGVTAEEIEAEFVGAASLLALATYFQSDPISNMEQIRLGEVTLQAGNGGAAAKCLRQQAEMLMMPYCMDGFSFRGV